MRTVIGLAVAAAGITVSAGVLADAQIDLGTRQRVTQLFSYPNNCSVVCFKNWTLEQTVEHYLTQSTQRDGYTTAAVTVTTSNNEMTADIIGVPDNYGTALTHLLNAGDSAFKGATQLNADGKWDFSWYFFLPLGMALENRKSVELLHFPPDYSLTQAQDYLFSKTTDRWAQLLTYNGVPVAQTPAYQTIVDIAPVAAPASAGGTLAGVYSYFTDYQTTMVKQTTATASGASLPMVAFGAPVRSWIEKQYGQTVGILGLATISPTPGQTVTVLGSNHPSYIWYAADKAQYGGNEAKADAAGLKVMGQDLSAACWQAAMGQNPSADPQATLNSCTANWQGTMAVHTCEIFYEDVRNLKPAQAQTICTKPPAANALKLIKTAKAPATPEASPLESR